MICPQCHLENSRDSRYCSGCATPLTGAGVPSSNVTETIVRPVEALAVGLTFAGRYHILEELGEGGMGRVYQALDTELQEKVALKLIKSKIAADEKTVQRFRNELKLARKIIHKNVCRMYDLNISNGTYFITMEYVSGENLKASLRRVGPLSVGKALHIADQICSGLEEAHRLGFIHRDLKPQNIMIDRDGVVRIMDFGIARDLAAAGLTDDGQMVGTLEYMSPEQLEGKKADERSDIYSFGVILYEMMTGRIPFEGETPVSIAAKHITTIPVEPRVVNTNIPEGLSRIIMTCLEKEREKRFQTVGDLAKAIRSIQDGLTATTHLAAPEAARRTGIRPAIGRRKAIFLLAPVVLIAAAAAVYFFVIDKGKTAPARPEVQPVVQQPVVVPSASPKAPEVKAPEQNKPEAKPLETKLPEPKAAGAKPPESTPSEAKTPPAKAPAKIAVPPARPTPVPDNKPAPPAPAVDVAAGLETARQAFKKEDFPACLEALKPILAANPSQPDALELQAMVQVKMAPQQLRDLVAQYVKAFNGNALLAFYRQNGSPELIRSIESDIELLAGMHEGFNALVSKVDVKLPDARRGELSFSCIATATARADGKRHVVFDGTYRWSLEQRADRWTITLITATPAVIK
jgi:serine/threonine protein kinase